MKRLAVVLSLFLAGTTGADVLVKVKIDSPQMAARYKPRTAEVEQAIAAEVARMLARYFRHWAYVQGPSVPPHDYTLAFRIHKEGGEQLITLTLHTKEEIGGTWTGVWMKTGELALRGFPDSNVAGPRVAEDIEKILLGPRQFDIGPRMKSRVPVATAAQWQRVVGPKEELRLVVPLRWPGSQGLVNSIFRVKCTWPGRGPAELQTRALDLPALYVDEQNGNYEALTLRPLTRIFGDQKNAVTRQLAREVRALQPIVVYLEDDDPMGLHLAGVRR